MTHSATASELTRIDQERLLQLSELRDLSEPFGYFAPSPLQPTSVLSRGLEQERVDGVAVRDAADAGLGGVVGLGVTVGREQHAGELCSRPANGDGHLRSEVTSLLSPRTTTLRSSEMPSGRKVDLSWTNDVPQTVGQIRGSSR